MVRLGRRKFAATMKITAAALLFALLAHAQDAAASTTLQRKRSGRGEGVRELVSDAKYSTEDQALWERILQDAGMSMVPPTGTGVSV